jgi:two-component system LytT family response regulator
MLRALIVDDEAPARRKIARFLREHPDIEAIGEASDGAAAVEKIRSDRPDLVFLDIQMPGVDGFGVIEAIAGDAQVPHIIFVTAHDRYAVRAFDVCAIDYLLKPFDQERFDRALSRLPATNDVPAQLRALLDGLRSGRAYADRLLVPSSDKSLFVPVADIVRVESDRNHVTLHCRSGSYTLRSTLESLETRLDPAHFVRINRSHLVRIDRIKELHTWFHGEYKVVLHDGTSLPWSRRYAVKRPDLLKSV